MTARLEALVELHVRTAREIRAERAKVRRVTVAAARLDTCQQEQEHVAAAEVRAWARTQGLRVADRGVISNRLKADYIAYCREHDLL